MKPLDKERSLNYSLHIEKTIHQVCCRIEITFDESIVWYLKESVLNKYGSIDILLITRTLKSYNI